MATATRSPAALLLVLFALPAAATEPGADPAPESTEPLRDESVGCVAETPPDGLGIDTLRAGLERGICSMARFVDRVFGRDIRYAEYEDDTNGRASITLGWDEQDQFNVDTRFRASVNLPRINERFNATIGRASRDEYISDEIWIFNPAIRQFTDDESAEWFAGLGYRAHETRDSNFDLGAGVKLESPLNPYANVRFRHYVYGPPGVLMTLRTTAFVENDEGFGLTQAVDVDKVLDDRYMLRFRNSVRWSEDTAGVRWRIRPALYQAIDDRSAMRYEAYVRGETDGEQPDLYGVGVTHRRSAFRDWLFFEFGGELFWAEGPEPADRCRACIGVAVGFEIFFGEAYDRVLRRDAGGVPEDAAGAESRR